MKDTRSKIISAAIQVISNRPTASIEEISESIGLNRRTVHRYFKGKSDLIEAITHHACMICLTNAKDSLNSSNNSIDQLRAMFISDIQSGKRFRFLYNFHSDINNVEERSPEFKEMMTLFRNLLKSIHSSKQLSPNLTLKWVESLYFSTIDAAIRLILEVNSSEDEIIEMAWMSYLNAIINPEIKLAERV